MQRFVNGLKTVGWFILGAVLVVALGEAAGFSPDTHDWAGFAMIAVGVLVAWGAKLRRDQQAKAEAEAEGQVEAEGGGER